ncbi:hypothetical protein SAMN05444164_4808 [Bradyrhizobium erythrophlei]|uniref:Uncharacterized protein n=1 Tax=Bradyrhizobium erythrophlei TaxID=1437360 RepID=A0A1H5AU42_9BRAD|nr:hypothetical protein SAMN05444164_4808 [Bradyrhizobium erythrophlei]
MVSWGLGEEEYFLRVDWTGCVALNLQVKFVFWRTVAAAVEQALRHRLDAAGWLPACTALQFPAPKARAVHSPRGRQLPGVQPPVAPIPFKSSQSISFALFTSAPSSRAPRA